jgi:hypothetical protein
MAKLVAVLFLFWFIFCQQNTNGEAIVYLGSYFARRLPMAKLVAAQLSILVHNGETALVHILSADCQWQSWWRRCCLFWFIFCPQAAIGEAVWQRCCLF